MRAANFVTASLLMLLGGVVLFDAVRLGIGWGSDGPMSGFFPFWLALIMLVTCGIIIVQTFLRASRNAFVTWKQLVPVLQVLWPATAMVLLINYVGLYVAAGLYLGFYMKWVGRHSWLAVVVLSVAIPVTTFMIFELWFLVPMPKGPLESWLGY
jgi:putative tricarboxylic transport membrane protein